MDHYAVLISGDTSVEELRALIAPITPGTPRTADYGCTFSPGPYDINDAELDGIYYVDDFGLPLSRYRFEVSTPIRDGLRWSKQVFELLSRETTLDLLCLTNSQYVEGERTMSTAA